MPTLDTSKVVKNAGAMLMTTREEQEQYRLQGIQDGMIEELEFDKEQSAQKKRKNRKRNKRKNKDTEGDVTTQNLNERLDDHESQSDDGPAD